MKHISITLSGGARVEGRSFAVREAMSRCFEVDLEVVSHDPSLALEAILGRPAALELATGYALSAGGNRRFVGILAQAAQARPEPNGLSSYRLRLVPRLWLLQQRRGYRIFQHVSIPDIVKGLLDEWRVEHTFHIDPAGYPKLELKVQYGETDYAFVSRLLEEAGITFRFATSDKGETVVVLDDAPQEAKVRPGDLPFVDNPNASAEAEYVTELRHGQELRANRVFLHDYDFRNPLLDTHAIAERSGVEHGHELVHYLPGVTLAEQKAGGDTPVADDLGTARYRADYGAKRAERVLEAARVGREFFAFGTNVADLAPGVVLTVSGHPHPKLESREKLLVIASTMEGTAVGEWDFAVQAVPARVRYRPPLVTPKPRVFGVQSAIVAGPKGQEIHTDEFGRIRLQFPWDREGKHDERSSCWVRVSQGWAGKRYGWLVLPRVGHEVLVDFLDGDPDQPIVVGRVYNATNPVPYTLPEHKTQSGWKSDSSPSKKGAQHFNEILFEDKRGDELFAIQAQKDHRRLVKRSETITVRRNRKKEVHANETDTTGVNRTEITGINRTETTGATRTEVIGVHKLKLIGGHETQRTEASHEARVGGNVDSVTKGVEKRLIERDDHLVVKKDRRQRIVGTQSLIVHGDQQEVVHGRHALAAGKDMHVVAGEALVGEAGEQVTLRGPGGFIRIDAAGVTIKGKVVKINVGGKPGKGRGSKPAAPELPKEAKIVIPGPEALESWAPAKIFRKMSFEGTGKVLAFAKLDKLSPEFAAMGVLRAQGRSMLSVRTVLESGMGFAVKPLAKGQKLFRFVSKGRVHKDSPFWMDDKAFAALKAKHFHGGKWDLAAVRGVTGIPEANAMDAVLSAEVVEAHEGVESTILPATDLHYEGWESGTVIRRVKPLRGGGKQVSPDTRKLGKMSVVDL